jgi:hypothetical protein
MKQSDFDSSKLDHYYVQWISVVAPVFGWHHDDSTLLRILCYYCQWCVANEIEGLPRRIADIKQRLHDPERYGLAGHEYCNKTGEFFLVQSDGQRVPIGTTFSDELSDDEMIEIFGLDFLSMVDRKWHRHKLINDLVDGEDNGRSERDVQDKEGLDIRQRGKQNKR